MTPPKFPSHDTARGTRSRPDPVRAAPPLFPLMVSIGTNGMLKISGETARELNIRKVSAVKFAQANDLHSLCLILCKELDGDSFSVRAFLGDYFVDAHRLFRSLGIDYDAGFREIEFTLSRQEDFDGQRVFLTQRAEG